MDSLKLSSLFSSLLSVWKKWGSKQKQEDLILGALKAMKGTGEDEEEFAAIEGIVAFTSEGNYII